jgi:hypothetical protein
VGASTADLGQVHKRTSERAIVGHLSGVLRLLEFRGPDSHMFGVAHGCFVGMRPYWVSGILPSGLDDRGHQM